MEWERNLRRAQSLRTFPSSCDQSPWADAGLKDKTTSVSQLVARYQTTVEISTVIRETSVNNDEAKPKQVIQEQITSLLEAKETHLESPMWKHDERKKSQTKTSLTRSKSVGSLHNSAGSIDALRALFESKAATDNTVKSTFRAGSLTLLHKAAGIKPVMNGEAEKVRSSAEEPNTQIPTDTPVNDPKTDAKEHPAPQKVVNHTRMQRRKTIGGIDFEKIAASQADEKRRSVADFRDSSFTQTKEKPCVSVKAMSALYLSKVAPEEPTHSLLKPAQDQSSESGKQFKRTKMAEDSQQRKDDLPPPPSSRHQPGPEDVQQFIPSHLSKEKLHQQRQKCELRRLLKHTHPELKMLDEVVDEELAEVLSSEAEVTAAETGYEGEVLSRRLIFENCALSNKVSPYAPEKRTVEGAVERGDVSKTSAVLEEHEERPCSERIMQGDKMLSPDLDRECEEEKIRIDVKATRRIFESQPVDTSRLNPDRKFQGQVSISGDKTGAVQKRKKQDKTGMCGKDSPHSENKSNTWTKSLDLTDQLHRQGPCVHVIGQSSDHEFPAKDQLSTGVFEHEPTCLPDRDNIGEIIKTSATLFQNNPFIQSNFEREHSFAQTSTSQSPSEDDGDYRITNVKNRAHLFESMPFDKIRHQNKDEIEMMVENIKETLNSLYHFNAIHSGGSIIEVNETMIAKKARFILSESGPKIKYDEVAEGGAQNFILQLLPRAHLKPQIKYLKEDSKGSMEARVVNVPVHQHQFTTNQDTEFKTANVLQLVEDVLNQDNSLRKGVIILEDVGECAEVIVYSLYNYFDGEDVKSYSCPQGAENDDLEPGRGGRSKTDNQESRKGGTKSAVKCPLEMSNDQTCQVVLRPEIPLKGNVKLFKSCIEKGDLEYLKTLQAEPTEQEQELSAYQNVAGQDVELHCEQRGDQSEESTEWVPVDVKRLKSMFSGDQRPTQSKVNECESIAKSATISCGFTHENVPPGKSETQHKKYGQTQQVCNSTVLSQGLNFHLETQDDSRIHQAELVEVIDENDEISSLQTAIHSLQQATIEAKSLQRSSQQQYRSLTQEELFSKEPDVKQLRTEAELPQENEHQIKDPYQHPETRRDVLPSASYFSSEHKSELQHENTETCHKDKAALASEHSSETDAQNEDEEIDFQGKFQAALDSLGRSNINVTRGDFRAAMIYKNSFKPYKEISQNVDEIPVEKSIKEVFCPVNEHESTQSVNEQVTAANAEPPSQSGTQNKPVVNAVSEKSRRPVGPKPAILPKPEHLKMKQREIKPVNPKIPGANTTPGSVDLQRNKLFEEAMFRETEVNYQIQGSGVTLESDNTDKNVIDLQQEINARAKGISEGFPVKENMNETDESHVDFHEVQKKFAGKKEISVKTAPVKPKRVKIAQTDSKYQKHTSGDNDCSVVAHVVEEQRQTLSGLSCNNPSTCGQTAGKDKDMHEKGMKQESKVEMREKKGRTETEDERRQRLSVHMDEIMRGNITAAMEIFDNLRKQEELQSILSRVEEIEQDTSEVDVRSLRAIYENAPDWVVSSEKKKQKKLQAESKEERLSLTKDITESKSSMAHVFGDLERASEEIMNLKEQTLARLLDIEEAIKKALYSVSTLKSDSDIAGLSCLLKESLGTVPGSPSSGNISKISIGSSRTKSSQMQERPTAQGSSPLTVSHSASIKVASAKQRASPPSSPAFISIQSAARKTDKTEVLPPETSVCPTCQHSPKTEEKFRTTKTLTCNSPAQDRKSIPRKGGQKQPSSNLPNPKRELSVLEVQTDHEGNSIMGTKTVTENYERTDNFGNRYYSSKTSTVVSALPETTTSTGQEVAGPAMYQVIKYPEVQVPINQKP